MKPSSNGVETPISSDELQPLVDFILILMRIDQRIKKSQDKNKDVKKS
jgi:hypothetical protein